MTRRLVAIAAAVILACVTLPVLADAPMPVVAYLYDPCGGCAGVIRGCNECEEELALHNALSVILREAFDENAVTLRTKNLLDPVYNEEFKAYMDATGVFYAVEDLPVYIIGDGAYAETLSGPDAKDRLPEVIAEAIDKRAELGLQDDTAEEETELIKLVRNDSPADIAEGDSVIVYFYKEWCPYCLELKALMDSIPTAVTLPGGESSQVRFIGLNKEAPEEMAIVQTYYDMLGIGEDRQYVPMAIVGDKDLFLYDEIVPGLLEGLLSGDAVHTPTGPLLEGE